MGDLQRKIAQEEKRQALSRLNNRLGLSTFQGKEMENFDAGIQSTNFDFDESTRSQRIENVELQKQKLRKNLLKLFGDDDESTGISYSYISEDPDDMKFFNMNFNKIYTDLNNMYDLDYLNGDTLNRFFERYKLKYNDDKFGIDLFEDVNEEKEIVEETEKPVYQTPIPSQIYGNATPQPENTQTPNVPLDETLENLVIEYVSVKHKASEYPDILKLMDYVGISTDGLKGKTVGVKYASAMARLKKLFDNILKYKTKKLTRDKLNKSMLELNQILKQQLNTFEDYEGYMADAISRIGDYISDETDFMESNIDIKKLMELCERKKYNFVGYNEFDEDYPENKDIFIDQLKDGKAYIVEDLNLGRAYIAHEINHSNLKMVKDGRISVYYEDTNRFEDERPNNNDADADADEEADADAGSETGSNSAVQNLMNDYSQAELPENIPLPDDDDDDDEDLQEQAGTGFRRRNTRFKKKTKNLTILLKNLGYKIKK